MYRILPKMTHCSIETITKGHEARNPSIGEDLMREQIKVVPFTCSGKLREMIIGNK
jgi:nucleoid DNA-binding protein